MKKIFAGLILSLMFFPPIFNQNGSKVFASQAQPAFTNYTDCIRQYRLPYEKLYALALSSINANKYNILEIQSRNGYAMFETGGKEFLLSVLRQDKTYSYVKISPADNNYYFSPAVPQKIFNYIDLNFNLELKELKY